MEGVWVGKGGGAALINVFAQDLQTSRLFGDHSEAPPLFADHASHRPALSSCHYSLTVHDVAGA